MRTTTRTATFGTKFTCFTFSHKKASRSATTAARLTKSGYSLSAIVVSGALTPAGSSVSSNQASKKSSPRIARKFYRTQQLLTMVGPLYMSTSSFFNKHLHLPCSCPNAHSTVIRALLSL